MVFFCVEPGKRKQARFAALPQDFTCAACAQTERASRDIMTSGWRAFTLVLSFAKVCIFGSPPSKLQEVLSALQPRDSNLFAGTISIAGPSMVRPSKEHSLARYDASLGEGIHYFGRWVNKRGGIQVGAAGRYDVHLTSVDFGRTPDEIRNATLAARFASPPCHFMVAPAYSSRTKIMAPIATDHGALVISALASANDIYARHHGRPVFGFWPAGSFYYTNALREIVMGADDLDSGNMAVTYSAPERCSPACRRSLRIGVLTDWNASKALSSLQQVAQELSIPIGGWEVFSVDTPPLNCPCLTAYPAGVSLVSNELQVVAEGGVSLAYPGTYGLYACGRHDSGLEPSCNSNGYPPWCEHEWCYVDPAACNTGYAESAYVVGLHYSYGACGFSNEFESWFSTEVPEAGLSETLTGSSPYSGFEPHLRRLHEAGVNVLFVTGNNVLDNVVSIINTLEAIDWAPWALVTEGLSEHRCECHTRHQ